MRDIALRNLKFCRQKIFPARKCFQLKEATEKFTANYNFLHTWKLDIFHSKAERAMSRISDVVNKIMQISGEMNTLRSCKLS